MPKTNKTKTKVTITLDTDLVQTIKKHNLKLSTLCNIFLKKHLSLVSNPNSLSFHNPEVPSSSLGMGIFEGLETSVLRLEFKSMYFKEKICIVKWLNSKCSEPYSKSIINTLEKIFIKCNSINDIKIYIGKGEISKKSSSLAFRVFLNYCEEKELIGNSLIELARKRIKLSVNKGVDTFVPTKSQIEKSLSKIKKVYPKYEIYYKIILESGCRFTELKHMILNFDENHIEKWDDEIILYRNFYIRGNKSSYYIFISKQTYNRLQEVLQTNESILECFKERIRRNKDIISVKYLRKYQMQLMLENNIPLEVCDFIQGRGSSSVGFNHYTNKKILAVREYLKISRI